MALSKIKIVGRGPQGRAFKIFLDDVDISHELNRATFVWDATSLNQVILEFVAPDVEVSEEFEALVYKRLAPDVIGEYGE